MEKQLENHNQKSDDSSKGHIQPQAPVEMIVIEDSHSDNKNLPGSRINDFVVANAEEERPSSALLRVAPELEEEKQQAENVKTVEKVVKQGECHILGA
jgi:hypothetical protein